MRNKSNETRLGGGRQRRVRTTGCSVEASRERGQVGENNLSLLLAVNGVSST